MKSLFTTSGEKQDQLIAFKVTKLEYVLLEKLAKRKIQIDREAKRDSINPKKNIVNQYVRYLVDDRLSIYSMSYFLEELKDRFPVDKLTTIKESIDLMIESLAKTRDGDEKYFKKVREEIDDILKEKKKGGE